MALNKYILTSTVAVAAGAPATPVAGEPGTGAQAGFGSVATPLSAAMFVKGMAIVLDPAGPWYAAIGAGNLRAFTDGDTVGRDGTSN
jgi:hypothetical protein